MDNIKKLEKSGFFQVYLVLVATLLVKFNDHYYTNEYTDLIQQSLDKLS